MEEALDVKGLLFRSGVVTVATMTDGEMLGSDKIEHYDSDGNLLEDGDDMSDLDWLIVGPTRDGYYFTVFVSDYDKHDSLQ